MSLSNNNFQSKVLLANPPRSLLDNLIVRPCSVQLRKWSPSSYLQLDVENSYQDDVEDRSSDSEDEKIWEEKEETYDEHLLQRSLKMNKNKTTSDLECHKCGRISKSYAHHKRHVLSHYYKVFHNVLPNIRPFLCPVCNMYFRDKTTLVHHYAFSHKKANEMTDCYIEEASIASLVSSDGESKRTTSLSKCPKCDKKLKSKTSMRKHALSHYYPVFFDVLPDSHPFDCPICGKKSRDRATLTSHYAFGHRKVFQLTDLTAEDLHFKNNHVISDVTSETDEKRLNNLLNPYPPVAIPVRATPVVAMPKIRDVKSSGISKSNNYSEQEDGGNSVMEI